MQGAAPGANGMEPHDFHVDEIKHSQYAYQRPDELRGTQPAWLSIESGNCQRCHDDAPRQPRYGNGDGRSRYNGIGAGQHEGAINQAAARTNQGYAFVIRHDGQVYGNPYAQQRAYQQKDLTP